MRLRAAIVLGVMVAGGIGAVLADGGSRDASLNVGPYNASFLEGGIGISRPLGTDNPGLAAGAPWTLAGWIKCARRQAGRVGVAGMGVAGQWRGIVLEDGRPALALAPGVTPSGGEALEPGRWYWLAATYDGAVGRLFVDQREVASAPANTVAVPPRIELAPAAGADGARHFGGSLASFTLLAGPRASTELRALATPPPNFALVVFDPIGVGWPWQEHAWRGLLEPQDPWTLPHANAPPSAPVATPPPPESRALRPRGNVWLVDSWHLAAAPGIDADAEQLASPEYAEHDWYRAVVPGTVLTTLIARGVYPDPDYGLNNMVIPESLAHQDYWYRSVFVAPASFRDRDLTLTFKGINYAAQVWLNGRLLGTIHGAFTRGSFDVTGIMRPGAANGLAVRVAPPPHPGIAHEQSIAAGPGNNGGAMAIDGPTFVAAEGWDWIPGIRDRNTGIWQEVEVHATGALHLGDVHVVTHLPLPRTDTADISIAIPVDNRRGTDIAGKVTARIEGVTVEKTATFKPGLNDIVLNAAEYPQLHWRAPRLWWPNGYGPAELYRLEVGVDEGAAPSDSGVVRFGIRELSYELSLFDRDGRLRRVEVDPAAAPGEPLIDVRHEAIKRTPQGWAESLTAAGERSPAVRSVPSEALTPYLAIRVNGVPIAARGGSWGMDDSRKRIARERLEPYFRLHRAAHLNIIRNWLGQNTEDVFYDLADEYGLLVLNDFWASTQDFQVEPQDPALFLANARDVISRYRNHPSIAVWFGRNEGVPQPILNQGLADLTSALDGTRYYTGSSNSVNLQGSGPYNYRPPEQYFTELAGGFSVEVGTPSLATLESLRAAIPPADLWPLNDTYAYHDWHFGGNGDVATFMAALAERYGAGVDLEDFERKAQMLNYESYRAIFEGFQAHLWTRNSGRLLWMTHPSWPSNAWQIYSSDYDAGAAYYAVKKACEPLHAQLDLPDFAPAVVNTSREPRAKLLLRSRVLSLDNHLLGERVDHVDAQANAVAVLAPLDELLQALTREPLVLVRLTLTDAAGVVLSTNDYWQARAPAAQRRLADLAPQAIGVTARAHRSPTPTVTVRLTNDGRIPAVAAKLTLLDSAGGRVLPVYLSDNYVTLLPGEVRELEVECPLSADCARVAVRGWNVRPQEVRIAHE